MLGSTGVNIESPIYIKAPSEYMAIDPGEYVYDFQVRRKDNYSSANPESGAIYSTWIYGTFTVIEDITQV
jgi:hypothetical protein